MMADGLHNAIHEFLIKNNFTKTLEQFQEEVQTKEQGEKKKNFDRLLIDVRALGSVFDA